FTTSMSCSGGSGIGNRISHRDRSFTCTAGSAPTPNASCSALLNGSPPALNTATSHRARTGTGRRKRRPSTWPCTWRRSWRSPHAHETNGRRHLRLYPEPCPGKGHGGLALREAHGDGARAVSGDRKSVV